MPLSVTVKCLNNMKWTFYFERDADSVTLRDVMTRVNAEEPILSEGKEVNCIIMNQQSFRDGWDRSLASLGYNGNHIIALVKKPTATSALSNHMVNSATNSSAGPNEEVTKARDNETDDESNDERDTSNENTGTDDSDSDSGSDSDSDSVDNRKNEYRPYTKTYSADVVKQAILKNGDIMFNIICDIARTNPFFLSYLAMNPTLAKAELNRILSTNYTLTIKCMDETEDIIKTINMHPSGDNGYQIDQRNVQYIMNVTGISGTNTSNFSPDKVMEFYLWCDRDIQQTIEGLGGSVHTSTGM
jgi:hypothetical protein